MKVGLLSDTHDNLPLIEVAAAFFRREGIRRVLHLGDVTRAPALAPLQDLDLTVVAGNNDRALPHLPREWTGLVDGVPVAAIHGHEGRPLRALVTSGHHRFVFRGHSHKAGIVQEGPTKVVNPGALQRARTKSLAVLDTRTEQIRFFEVTPDAVRPWDPVGPKAR